MTGITATDLLGIIQARAAGQDRLLVAIAGPPGSGTSTLAADLAARLGPTAVILPMDGFHLDNDRLRQLGLLHRKGAPETFDAMGFISLLRDVRARPDVPFPTFDRDADSTVPDSGHIRGDTRIVLVEGNYLLLKTPPWTGLSGLFDLTVRVDVSRKELEKRLVARWRDQGLPATQARARALGNDMKNADFMIENSHLPEFTLTTEV